jgi:hypothetical protein
MHIYSTTDAGCASDDIVGGLIGSQSPKFLLAFVLPLKNCTKAGTLSRMQVVLYVAGDYKSQLSQEFDIRYTLQP